ncbi:MAG: TIM barrel protein [Anaerotruncus sp.]|nr:TIM barrel protein [Anaerotruncus sp.]
MSWDTVLKHLTYIKSKVSKPYLIKVCTDTCHMSDAGYDVFRFDELLDEFDKVIGLENLRVVQLNDSKNEPGAKKDRHANLSDMDGLDLIFCIRLHHIRVWHQFQKFWRHRMSMILRLTWH